MPRLLALLILGLLALPAGALAAAKPAYRATAAEAKAQDLPHVEYAGLQKLSYRYGPIDVTPGQNTIVFRPSRLKPSVPGYITRFKPNLKYADGRVPRVDVLHLHHGVWLMRGYPTFAAGEEKTIFQAPQGYGYKYDPSDSWVLNYMIHNLLPNRSKVYLTWDIDFVPADSAAGASMTELKPLFMDVAGLKFYPVFDVRRGSGAKGRFTFPQQARGAQRQRIGPAHQWDVPEDITLVGTGGHLHPGGLWTELSAQRGGSAKEVFRSEARYFEPAGAVSWDVAMTVTKPGWRVALNKGDKLNVSATYDSARASWYESMGIMNVWYATGHEAGAKDPFTSAVDTRGVVSHGRLPENDNHGNTYRVFPDARDLLSGTRTSRVDIQDFIYGRGDLSLPGRAGRPVVVKQGSALTFRNLDSRAGGDPDLAVYHTITACKAPCNREVGVAYPLADGKPDFDSGELGFGPSFATAAANRATWKTPTDLGPGTYTYFCRVHPFMRGAFKVVPR